MKKISNEAKVGFLVLGTVALAAVFAWAIGVQNPFKQTVDFYVTYNFAGGIDVGSPVRVSGIKVGKVEKIEFFTPVDAKKVAIQEPGSDEQNDEQAIVPLKVKISIRREAAYGVRKDSRFYINLAGIIGERYIEITPGSKKSPQVAAGEVMEGIDPPRIDQLISQSFDLAGKIADVIERNKGDITKSIELLYKLSGNLNVMIKSIDKSALFKTDLSQLIGNLISLTSDLKKITHTVDGKFNSPEGEKTMKLMHELLWRLEPLNPKEIRQFFQQEGMKVRLF